MNDSSEEIRSHFLVDEEAYEKEIVDRYIEAMLPYCKITKGGRVIIQARHFPDWANVGLVVLARYVGNNLDKSITAEVTVEEIGSQISLEKSTVSKRCSELVSKGLILRTDFGKYKANPVAIDDFLESLSSKTTVPKAKSS